MERETLPMPSTSALAKDALADDDALLEVASAVSLNSGMQDELIDFGKILATVISRRLKDCEDFQDFEARIDGDGIAQPFSSRYHAMLETMQVANFIREVLALL